MLKIQKPKYYNVYLNGKWIDSVQYIDYTTEEVKKSLIAHDGYSPDITVRERKAWKR